MVIVISVHATQAWAHVRSPAGPGRAAETAWALETGKDELRKEALLRVWHDISQEPEDHKAYSVPATQFSSGKTTSPNSGRM